MKHRKLRVAWSVGSVMFAVLLVVLLVRSYKFNDMLFGPVSRSSQLCFGSTQGRVSLMLGPRVRNEWQIISVEISDGEDLWAGVWKDYDKVFGFGTFQQGSVRNTVIPHLALAMFFGVIAAAPWLRRRFSLRGLLIVMTLAAIALGILATFSG